MTYESRHKLQCTENFIDAIKTKKILDDHELLCFDVKSLFTASPLQRAIDCSTEVAIKNSAGDLLLNNSELTLLTDDIMDLLNLCLTSTYFQYNGYGFSSFCCYSRNCNEKHHGTSPRYLQAIIPRWLCYVDDTFAR